MKKIVSLFLLAGFLFFMKTLSAQDVYMVPSGELIFQWSDVDYDNTDVHSNMRFSVWFHFGEYLNVDFTNTFGMYTGLAIRNVGFITEEAGIKTKYRSYNLGLPLAVKLGSFKKNFYAFAGAEYEMLFHFKQKTFVGDTKTKYGEWFSDRTNMFLPSVFGGVQLPAGIHLTFKYYLDNFLNRGFYKTYDDAPSDDYSRFNNTQVFYISISSWIPYKKLKEMDFNNMGAEKTL